MSMVREINALRMLGVSQALTPRDFEEFVTRFAAPNSSSFRTFYLMCNGGFPSEEETEQSNCGLPVTIKHEDFTIKTLIDCLISDSVRFRRRRTHDLSQSDQSKQR